MFFFFFFFSSRRRHTRCGRDWSSDVCSSDLDEPTARTAPGTQPASTPRLTASITVCHGVANVHFLRREGCRVPDLPCVVRARRPGILSGREAGTGAWVHRRPDHRAPDPRGAGPRGAANAYPSGLSGGPLDLIPRSVLV